MNIIRRGRLAIVALLSMVLLGPGLVATASTASALEPTCTGDRPVGFGSYQVVMPSNEHEDLQCAISTQDRNVELAGTKDVQRALNTCHGAELAVDGHYGPATASEIARVQREEGLDPDGNYTPVIRSSMKWPYLSKGSFHHCDTAEIWD